MKKFKTIAESGEIFIAFLQVILWYTLQILKCLLKIFINSTGKKNTKMYLLLHFNILYNLFSTYYSFYIAFMHVMNIYFIINFYRHLNIQDTVFIWMINGFFKKR